MARNIQLVIVASLAFFAGIGVDKYLSADEPVAQYQSLPSSPSNQILEKNYAEATQQNPAIENAARAIPYIVCIFAERVAKHIL